MRWKRYHRCLTARRLQLEREVVNSECPGFKLSQGKKGNLSWEGNIRTVFGQTYRVEIAYTKNYPLNEPQIYVSRNPARRYGSARGPGARRLCRWTSGNRWSPARSTAVVTLRQAAEWLHRFDRREQNGVRFGARLTNAEKKRCLDELKHVRTP